ncbi:hypothetical protein [Legionella massiliensis]|uniref:hypothetical protein n=1 Tax=Legionella massiliensis TaxID=1034943 RepID=UPI0005C37BB0|nr:hypothetical protein [Legionella massiliensis]
MEPIYLKGNEHAVMLLYGLNGSPLEIIYLATKLNAAGFTVEIPHIQGYAYQAGQEIFNSSERWIEQAMEHYKHLNPLALRILNEELWPLREWQKMPSRLPVARKFHYSKYIRLIY